MAKRKRKGKVSDYVKANRKGSREATLDNGWKAIDRAHKNKKKYIRKVKHKLKRDG